MGVFLKVFLSFVPCAVISGLLYIKVLLALRTGSWNKNKAHVSKVLCILWASWVLLNIPFLIFELAMQFQSSYQNKRATRYSVYWSSSRVSDNLSHLFAVSPFCINLNEKLILFTKMLL